MKIIYVIDSLKMGGKENRLLSLIQNLPENFSYSILLLDNKIEFEIENLKKNIHYYKGNHTKLSKLIWFTKKIQKFKPDIVHSWYYESSLYSLPICKILNIKFITSEITNIEPYSTSIWTSYYYLKKMIFLLSDFITSNSLIGLSIYKAPRNKSCVIYNGYDFNKQVNLPDEKKIDIPPQGIFILMIANFTTKKDYKTYITAALKILETRKDVYFMGIGKGRLLESMQKSIPEIFKKNIIFPGFVRNVFPYIERSNIGVLTSFGEGFPNSIMEFMAFKKPVIATSGGGTNELIKDNRNGILIPQKNHEKLTEAILSLINNPDHRSYLGTNAYNDLRSNYTIEHMVKMYVELYFKVIHKQ